MHFARISKIVARWARSVYPVSSAKCQLIDSNTKFLVDNVMVTSYSTTKNKWDF